MGNQQAVGCLSESAVSGSPKSDKLPPMHTTDSLPQLLTVSGDGEKMGLHSTTTAGSSLDAFGEDVDARSGDAHELGEAQDPEEEEEEEQLPVERKYTNAEAQLLRDAKRRWTVKMEELERYRRADEWQALLTETRAQMVALPVVSSSMPANRYGSDARLPHFDVDNHVPVLALINPHSGAMAGSDIMALARRSPYYKNRFFNIIDVVKDQRRGGLLDVFRIELCKAKDEAKALGLRPRIISGGGDGTASFSLYMIFAALRADPARSDEGLQDRGNGFIWTDEELEESFPALAQMPLGSANDFGHTLGWGEKYPGDRESRALFGAREKALGSLRSWIEAVIDPASRTANFDLFGIVPGEGQEACDFKLCELTGPRGMNPKVFADGKWQLLMKEASTPVPLFCCLYFSAGFAAYMTARFQTNRRTKPLHNKAEYARQALGIMVEQTPPQLLNGLDGVQVHCNGEQYFPPRQHDGNEGTRYREVGFLNINWQAGMANGSDRAPVCGRLCSTREPAKFNDGMLDMYRLKLRSAVKNPGLRIQTDKKEGAMTLSFDGGKGKGVFFQWDGEARFAFSPTGEAFNINVKKVLNIPVVLGPDYQARVSGDPDNGKDVRFAFAGDSPEQMAAIRRRILRGVQNELNKELNATREEMLAVGIVCQGDDTPLSAATSGDDQPFGVAG